MKNILLPILLLFIYLCVGCNNTGKVSIRKNQDTVGVAETLDCNFCEERDLKKKTITTYKSDESQEEDWEVTEVEIFEYSPEGYLERRSLLEGDEFFIEEYVLNEDNFVATRTVYTNSDTTKSIYQYEGNKGIIEYYTKGGEFIDRTLVEYNHNNDILSALFYAADGSLESKEINEYDEEGRLISFVLYDSMGNPEKEEKTTYDEIGLKSYYLNYIQTSLLHLKEERINDDKYFMEYKVTDYKNNETQRMYKQYDKCERLLEERTEYEDFVYHKKYFYDENGCLKEMVRVDKYDEPKEKKVYEYEDW